MAGRLRTASIPPKTLMESAVYSPSDLPAPFFPFFWSLSFCTSMGLLSSGAAAAADWGSFGTILLHSIGNTNRARVAASADRSGQPGLSSRITLIYLKFQWLKSLTIHFDCSTKEALLTIPHCLLAAFARLFLVRMTTSVALQQILP